MKSHENKVLFDAVFRGDMSEVLAVLDSCVGTADTVDQEKRTPLIHSSIDKNLILVKALVEGGADVNTKDFQDMTALHIAAQNYDLEMSKYLIAHGAEVDAQDGNGNTPLWCAEFEGDTSTELQESMIYNGANENLKHFHGVSPKDLRDG